jgi:2,3,4,5-tetrahydropyridine-2,6-dicarboxylate N-succinyltransferase
VTPEELRGFFSAGDKAAAATETEWRRAHEALLVALESGAIRAAERGPAGEWKANTWVKEAVLLGFRRSDVQPFLSGAATFHDKTAYPPRFFGLADGVRMVFGGTSIRRGAHVGRGVVVMPPAFVNVGAFVGEGSMVDSHALVGSCAQIGTRVHLSAGAQIGGVLEPSGARPVIIEDEAFVGGLCGVFEGVVVRARAVLAAGVILTAATTLLDLVHERELRGEVPEGAVVIPGSRPAGGAFAARRGIQVASALVVKYRDARTDAATALEEALR